MKIIWTTKKIVIGAVIAALLLGGGTTGIVLGIKHSKREKPENKKDIQITESMFTVPTAIENVRYNIGELEIINPGQTEYGTFMYKLGDQEWNSTTPCATNIGTYEVKWFIDAIDGYADYGSKEQPYTVTTAILKGIIRDDQITKPNSPDPHMYDGKEFALATPGTTVSGTFYYSLDKETWSTEVPKATNAGEYEVYWYIKGNENYEDYASIEEPKYLLTTILKSTITDSMVEQPESKTLTYTGEAQELITAGSCVAGTFYYSLDKETWSTNIPTGTHVGDYTIYWYVKNNGNYIDDYGSENAPETTYASIAKGNIAKVVAPTESDHSKGQLVNPGSSSGGTFMYSCEGSEWSDKLPTAFKEGEYTVKWYIDGGENYNDYGKTNPSQLLCTLTKDVITIDQVDFPVALTQKTTEQQTRPANPGISYTTGIKFYYSLDKQTWTEEVPMGVYPEGKFEVYWYVTGNSDFYGIGSQENPEVLVCTYSSRLLEYGINFLPPTPACPEYNSGNPVKLICEPDIWIDGLEDGDVGTFYYSLDGINYSEDIPTATEKGMYTVYWYLTAGNKYDGFGTAENPIVIDWIFVE